MERVKSFKQVVRAATFGCALTVFNHAIAEEQNNEMISTISQRLLQPVLVRAKVGVDASHFGLNAEYLLPRGIGSEFNLDFPMGASSKAPPWSSSVQFFFPLESNRRFYFAPQLSFLWQSSRLLMPIGARFQVAIEPFVCRLESSVLFRSDDFSARSFFLIEYPVSGSGERGAFLGVQIDHEYIESQDVTVGGQVTAGIRF